MKVRKLKTGLEMPLFGLGTYQLFGEEMYKSLDEALKAGYRLIDTAECYKNEVAIGNCLQTLLPKHGLSRADLFITSKLAPKDHGYQEAHSAGLQSVDRLKVDYLDLFLIHWPAKAKVRLDSPRHADYRKDSWLALERLYKEGKVKNIGISNYTIQHLEEISSYASIQPSVLQVEYHPLFIQEDLLEWCKANDVLLQTYAPLAQGKLLTEPNVLRIAEQSGKTSAQVLLQWALQQDLAVIPKSSSPAHIAENIAAWQIDGGESWLADADMQTLSGLNRGEKICWDPSNIP